MNEKLPNPQLRYAGTFGKIDFGQYTYVEFPKVIRSKGREATVNSQREELEVMTKWSEEDVLLGEQKNAELENHPAVKEGLEALKVKEALAEQAKAQAEEIERLKKELSEAKKPTPASESAPAPAKAAKS